MFKSNYRESLWMDVIKILSVIFTFIDPFNLIVIIEEVLKYSMNIIPAGF